MTGQMATRISLTPYELLLEIGELPEGALNARQHFRRRHALTKHWDLLISAITACLRPPTPLMSARLTLVRHSSVCPDFDNLASTWKHPVDALVSAGILADDGYKTIGFPQMRWEKAPPRKGWIEIHVRET